MAVDRCEATMIPIPNLAQWVALRAYGSLRFMNGVQGGVEDIEGAIAENQFGMLAFQARYVMQSCLSIRSLALRGEIDSDEESVSFDFLAGLDNDEVAGGLMLANEALEIDERTAPEWLNRFKAFVAETERLLDYAGPLPVRRSPEGTFGFMALTRRWNPFLQELGLPSLLPADWVPSRVTPHSNTQSSGSALHEGVSDKHPPHPSATQGGRTESLPHVKSDVAAERRKVLAAYRRHLSIGTARLADLTHAGVEARSSGSYVWTESGEKYLDFGGYGVFILGHCHPRVVNAVVEQARTHPTSTYFLLNRLQAEAAERLTRITPKGLDHVYFGASGAEAVETSLKLARLNGRRRIVAMKNGYHGMTLGALSVTGCNTYREPFRPLLQDVEFIPFGDAAALADALNRGPEACVILEPVQGEGGVIVPPSGYLSEVERLCRSHGAFLVLDEIQTGLGRLGSWWGADSDKITPDVLLVGKALSGGVVPVSAAVASERVFQPLSRDPMIHTSTFSGAPIMAAAATAAIDAIEDEKILDRAAPLGNRIRDVITKAVAHECPSLVRAVRGMGLLIGIEWEADHLALDFIVEMLDRHVILSHSMNAPRVTKLTPPAIISDEEIATFEAALRASAEALAKR